MNGSPELSYSACAHRVGLGWRPELGIDIFEKIDDIDILEIVAEHCTDLSTSELKAFSRLSSHVDVVVHGLSLGLASTYPVSRRHLDRIARVIDTIQPESWSEHLAFVRTDSREVGHLAAPPWSDEVVESTINNIAIVSAAIGSKPHLENIATLYKPIGSTLSEQEWTTKIIKRSGSKLLLDLENIYANSRNFGADSIKELQLFPLDDVQYVHIAGGREATDEHGAYFIDDHRHPVSEDVFQLLEHLAAHTRQPLTVILERDGDFPPFEQIAAELSHARNALRRGREKIAPGVL